MLTEQDVSRICQQQIDLNARKNVYSVSPIPFHTHNGVDSLQVDANDLTNAALYFAENETILTTADILSLNTTPVILVPALGTGLTGINALNTIIIVDGIALKIYAGAAAYAGANALEFRYTDAAGAKVTADVPNTFINTTANNSAYAYVAGVTTVLTPVPNSPIVVRVPTANPTTGTGRIVISVAYRVISL